MGESGSKPERSAFVENFGQTHQLIQDNYEDNRLGRVNVFKGQQGNYVAVKKSFNQGNHDGGSFSEKNVAQIIDTLSQCPYILKLLSYQEQDQQAMCGSVSQIETYHEFFLNNLEAEIQQRYNQNLYYSESELWVILYSIIQASSFLELYRKFINDIRPQNIYITPNGQLKLVPFGSFPDDFPAYNKTQTYRQCCYLAPEQLEELQQGLQRSTCSAQKADSYSIGITLLQCATLQSAVECYDYDQFCIRSEAVDYFIQTTGQRYSRFLVNLIKLLLEIDPKSRPLPSAIAKILQPYENQILSLQQFQPNYEVVKQSIQQSMMQEQQQVHYSQQATQQYQQQPTRIQQQPLQTNLQQQNQYSRIQRQEPEQYQQQNSYYQAQQLVGQQVNVQQPPAQYQQQEYQMQQTYQPPLQQQQLFQSTYIPQQQVISSPPRTQYQQSTQQNVEYGQTQYFEQRQQVPISTYQEFQRTTVQQEPQQYQQTVRVQQPQYQQVSSEQYAFQTFQPPIQNPYREVQYESQQNLNQSPIRLVQGPMAQESTQVRQFAQSSPPRQFQSQTVQQPQFNAQSVQQGFTQSIPPRVQQQPIRTVQAPQFQEQAQTSSYQPPQLYQQSQPQTNHYDNSDLSDIDKRINEVLSRTKNAMERVEKQQNEYEQEQANYQ